jgi:hypothetical protein
MSLDIAKGHIELFLAVTPLGAENLGGKALVMHPHHYPLVTPQVP